MTGKRFYVGESGLIDGYCVFDGEKKYAFSPRPRKADCLNDAHILNKLCEENEQLKSTLYYLLNVIQNKCSKNYPKCKETVRNCFENDFNNIENDSDVE